MERVLEPEVMDGTGSRHERILRKRIKGSSTTFFGSVTTSMAPMWWTWDAVPAISPFVWPGAILVVVSPASMPPLP